MNKKNLIDHLTQKKELSLIKAKKLVNLVFQRMMDTLAKGDRVEVRGFGSFAVKKYQSYQGRNPKTGELITVNPKKLPIFRPGKELIERVNNYRS